MRKPIYLALILVTLAVSSIAFADQPASPAGVVNINSADASQLALLPGVGVKSAQRIVEYRTEHGAFQQASDLMSVKGIGAKSFERIAPYVSLSGNTTLTVKIASPRKPRAKKS